MGVSYRATLYEQPFKSKYHFCMKNMDFVWKTPLEKKIGHRSQGESCWKLPTLGGVAHTWQPCRMKPLEVSIWLCMGAPNTGVFPDVAYMPKCSLLNMYSTWKNWKTFIAPFSRKFDKSLFRLFFVWCGNPKKAEVQHTPWLSRISKNLYFFLLSNFSPYTSKISPVSFFTEVPPPSAPKRKQEIGPKGINV